MSFLQNHVLLNCDISNVFIYKTLLGKRKKEEEDGMNLNYNIGRNARPAGCWHVPRISRRVNLVLSFVIYILEMEMTESIHFRTKNYMNSPNTNLIERGVIYDHVTVRV